MKVQIFSPVEDCRRHNNQILEQRHINSQNNQNGIFETMCECGRRKECMWV